MTKEQEAIERLNRIITTKFNNDYSIDSSDKEAIETVLSMLKEKDKEIELYKKKNTESSNQLLMLYKEQDNYYARIEKKNAEIEKKDKQIDLMAECIDVELSSARLGTLLNKNVKPLETYKEEIKQYFERKATKMSQERKSEEC